MSKIIDQYFNKASMSGKVPFFEPEIAIQIIRECKKENIRILGLDAVRMINSMTQPFMEHSVDYSDKKEAWDDAIAYIQSRTDLGLLFEVVCGDESTAGVSCSSIENLAKSHFNHSDGWLLCSLSEKFYGLKSIISTGDVLNHSIFTYSELNQGLLRLIQNGYAEESEGKFRITNKGEALRHKLSFPQGLSDGSISSMLKVYDKIVDVLTEVEVDYTIDAISYDEYRKAVKANTSLFVKWLRLKK